MGPGPMAHGPRALGPWPDGPWTLYLAHGPLYEGAWTLCMAMFGVLPLGLFPKHASGMRGSDINMVDNWVHALALAAGRPTLSETTLSHFWHLTLKT